MKHTKTINNLISRIVAIMLAVVLCFGTATTVFAAATKTEWNGHSRFKVDGNDAYCISFGDSVSSPGKIDESAWKYWKGLSEAKRDKIELAITAAHFLGYYNDTAVEYFGVQRYIWSITNPTKSKNSLSDWFKSKTQTVYEKVSAKVTELAKIEDVVINGTTTIESGSSTHTWTVDASLFSGYWKFVKWTGTGSSYLKYHRDGNTMTITLSDTTKTVDATAHFQTTKDWYRGAVKTDFYKYGNQPVIYMKSAPLTMTKPLSHAPKGYVKLYGKIKVSKVISYNGIQMKQGGVKFKIYNASNTYIKSLTTDVNGEAITNEKDLYLATITEGASTSGISAKFKVVEDCPDEYVPEDGLTTHWVTVTPGQTVTVTSNTSSSYIVNTEKLGDFLVHKKVNSIDENGKVTTELGAGENGSSAKGFTFRLTGTSATGRTIDMTSVTDENGDAYFCNVPIGDDYTLSEDSAGNEYVLGNSENAQTITIEWDGQKKYTKWLTTDKNEYQAKQSASQGVVDYANETGVKVNKLEYNETDGEDEIGTKDEEEIHIINEEDSSEYDESESSTGTMPGEESEESYDYISTAVIDAATANTLYYDYINIPKQWRIKADKIDLDTQISKAQGDGTLEGAVYELHREWNGIDTIVGTYTTNSEGSFTTAYYSVFGNYYLIEKTASAGYLLDTEKHYVFTENSGDTASSWGALTTLENFSDGTKANLPEKVKKAAISIQKYYKLLNAANETKVKESNAVFEIYLRSRGSYENARAYERDIVTTGKDGTAKTKDMPAGTYIIHQTASVRKDIALAADVEVTITENDKDVFVEIINVLMQGGVRINKTDEKHNPLSGAVFKVYKDSNQNKKYDEGTDELVGKLSEGKPGVYILEHLVFGGYFLNEDVAPDEYYRDDNFYYFEINQSGETVTVSNEDSEYFVNDPIIGTLILDTNYNPYSSRSPRTGNDIPLCGVVLIASGVSIIAVIRKRRRNEYA